MYDMLKCRCDLVSLHSIQILGHLHGGIWCHHLHLPGFSQRLQHNQRALHLQHRKPLQTRISQCHFQHHRLPARRSHFGSLRFSRHENRDIRERQDDSGSEERSGKGVHHGVSVRRGDGFSSGGEWFTGSVCYD